ncbi:CNNM family magnesium/cobalt transport protein CorC [Thorsellia anophelis]|uniref:Magnesium and cobalt efflux protein CorC n=1 Tax=Thorsellia anophelis DSM 18579 TaxID=1123402 RepID=A0A1I0BRH0_9GAMM|nr:CNNM family magnesium/cobalt transport protein CorC [Thorsellia anophelis]SET09302.1 magnesium and cobalt transporter [Thorsellia anophelis DSM 18579]
MSEENPPSRNLDKETHNSQSFISSLMQKLFKKPLQDRAELLKIMHEAKNEELIDPATLDMLEGVMDIADQRVRDIMIPRSQMVTLQQDLTLSACLDIITRSAHSRFPVIGEDKDHIEGILLAKDLLPFTLSSEETFELKKLLRPVVIVPESKRVDSMLKEFRSSRYHMAIVIDEFGGVSGLVTIEDILELIVGDIEDEFDPIEESDVRQLNKHTFSVKALIDIEEFNEIFLTHLSDEDVDTLGGLVMQTLGHLPERGEKVTIDGYLFKVTAADNRRIIQVQVTIPETAPTPILTNASE